MAVFVGSNLPAGLFVQIRLWRWLMPPNNMPVAVEATNRANLQIRGIGQQSTALIESLLAVGLGPVNVAGDDVRNLMLSPSAGIDPHMLIDSRPLAREILDSLQTHARFHELSAKFAVQLDGGEALAMLEHPA